ncbi:hypothetical protein NW762_012911 [Fusarium torreyae]|uniref:Uncharacterized protein n=1 Tax=Fusarium torreyae TaxID=1237075 RepID=A0A9W8V8C4_9HYPO|nr:hypothetical protein NW762_012911 [Fusarium torreyae]
MSVDYEEAKKVMDNFRSSIRVYSTYCAILTLENRGAKANLSVPLYKRVTSFPKTTIISILVPLQRLSTTIRVLGGFTTLGGKHGALRHYYEMCCIENMGAGMPMVEFVSTRLATSGTASAFSARTDIPATPSSCTEPSTRHHPVKRPRSSQSDQPQSGHGGREDDDEIAREHGQESKRRRLEDVLLKDGSSAEPDRRQEDVVDIYIPPFNNRQFLVDLNWELRRYIAS